MITAKTSAKITKENGVKGRLCYRQLPHFTAKFSNDRYSYLWDLAITALYSRSI